MELAALLTLFPWHNVANPVDVNQNGTVEPRDALMIINYLNADFPVQISPVAAIGGGPGFLDPSRDNFIAPNDALTVIDAINARLAGEGEGTEVSQNLAAGATQAAYPQNLRWVSDACAAWDRLLSQSTSRKCLRNNNLR